MDRNTFTHTLVGDVTAAHERLIASDTPTHRRELVRATFAAIEGLQWRLKRQVLAAAEITDLTIHERAALVEESYFVDDRGRVHTQTRFLALPTAIRLVVGIVKRYREDYRVDFNHVGWSNLKAALNTRNRLTHPKRLEELYVSDEEITQAMSAFHWMLALALEAGHETYEYLDDLVKVGQLAEGSSEDLA